MKVIIELNDTVSIESYNNKEIKIIIKNTEYRDARTSNICNIDDLRLALRKLTAK